MTILARPPDLRYQGGNLNTQLHLTLHSKNVSPALRKNTNVDVLHI